MSNFLQLPEDAFSLIYSFLTMEDVFKTSTVSSSYYSMLQNNSIWHQFYLNYKPALPTPKKKEINWKKEFYETPKWLKNKEEWVTHCSCRWFGNCKPQNILNGSYEYDMNGKGFNGGTASFNLVFDFKKIVELQKFAIYNLGDVTHDVKDFKLEFIDEGKKELIGKFKCEQGIEKKQEFGGFKARGRKLKFTVLSIYSQYQAVIREVEFFGRFE
jgi:hypothetical protein